jgi:hypothetical protein
MGLACSKLKTCKNNNHHIRGITCCKCEKDHDYCMDCDFPEWFSCCTTKPLMFRNMRFPQDRTISLNNYIWNKNGYFELNADVIKRNLEESQLKYERYEREKEESRIQSEKWKREWDQQRKAAACSQCGLPITELLRRLQAGEKVKTSPDQTCTTCFTREWEKQQANLCPYCYRNTDSYTSICSECLSTCKKCKKNINTPEYETITLRGENCPICKHNHYSKCTRTVEKIIEGFNVYHDTHIIPGVYYHNAIRREEPFRIRKEVECGCNIPITTERTICIHDRKK